MISTLGDRGSRDRITTDLGANLCVEAAAGTGKTTVLVERVTSLLATGTVDADELVVITFTEKAAAELSTRVRDSLERRAATADAVERERLLTAARDLYRAHIETIHSFATGLLRERPVEAGIDPLFEVLEGIAASLDFETAYDRFQDELLAEPLPEVELALRRGFGLAELREVCEHLHSHRDLLPLRHPPVDVVDVDSAVADLQRIADELRELLRRHSPPGDDRAVPIVAGIIEWVDTVTGLDPIEQERWLLFRRRVKTHFGAGSAANWGGEKPRMVELQRAYCDTVDGSQGAMRTTALLGVLPHVERFVAAYADDRKRRGRANFDDLLFWARDLLRESEAARTYFRSRVRAVLIDEFQDTDPVQAELALLLTGEHDPDADWHGARPAPGRLTIVGDPKQSIYRFRRADVALYHQVRANAFADGNERISTNFRSNPQLLAGLNAAFDGILKEEPGVQPGNVRLDAPPGADPARRAPIVVAEGRFDGSADETRAEEARVIAGLLHSARRDGWEIRDREHGVWRPCRWGDMAILMPARTGIENYEDALANAGIPYRHEGSRDFFQRDEVRDLIWVLAAIDDPTDRLALVGALRSSAFAINDEELVIHVAEARTLNYRSRRPGPSDAVSDALAELRDLHQLRRNLSLAEIVRRVVERTRLVEFALTRPDGEQGAANLLAIVDDARLFAAAGGGGLRPFIRHLRDSMEQEAIEIEATVAEETDDVVRIMTAHGAKGLEFPIVTLANLGGTGGVQRAPVPREDESFLHFRVGAATAGRSGHFATPGYDDVWEAEKRYGEAERLRLLYVAATRARDYLFVPCVVGRHEAKGLLSTLVWALPGNEGLVEVLDTDAVAAPALDREESPPVQDKAVDAAVAARESWIQERKDLRARAGLEREIVTASSRERAVGPLAAEVATFGASLLVADGPPIPVGDAVHMVMERVSLPDASNLEAIADDVCLEGDIYDQKDDVVAMCRACLEAPSVRRALASGRWWREVPFVLARGDGPGGPLATGRVDVVYEDSGELVVIDYKTDKDVTAETAETHARDKHSGQAEVYAQALSAATGLPVREVVFVYCKAGVEVRMDHGADSRV